MKNTDIAEIEQYTHQTAPTQYIEAAGIRFAYRRFGKKGNYTPGI